MQSPDVPVLETERLVLCRWREDDRDALCALCGDPDVTGFFGGIKDRAKAWRQLAAFAGHRAPKGSGPFAGNIEGERHDGDAIICEAVPIQVRRYPAPATFAEHGRHSA